MLRAGYQTLGQQDTSLGPTAGLGLASATTLASELRGISETERSLMTGVCAFCVLALSAAVFAAAFAGAAAADVPLAGAAVLLLSGRAGAGAFSCGAPASRESGSGKLTRTDWPSTVTCGFPWSSSRSTTIRAILGSEL